MNGGHTCLTIEDTKSPGFHADVRSLCDALGTSSEPPSSGRAEAATQQYVAPFADTLPSPESFSSARADWCVDTGPMMFTMTTFDLWEAVERGQVLAWMRVWREGMECWTPVGEIPQFAWALASTPQPPAEPAALPEPEPSAEATTGPLHAPTANVELPPESEIRPIAAPVSRLPGGARWVVVASAVAVAAVAFATFVREDSPSALPPAMAGASPLEVAQPWHPADDTPRPEVAHHEERGQHRLPRGGQRAYGR